MALAVRKIMEEKRDIGMTKGPSPFSKAIDQISDQMEMIVQKG